MQGAALTAGRGGLFRGILAHRTARGGSGEGEVGMEGSNSDEDDLGGPFDYFMTMYGGHCELLTTPDYRALLPQNYNVWDRFLADAQDSLAGFEPNADRVSFLLSVPPGEPLPDYAVCGHHFPMLVSSKLKALLERFTIRCVEFGPARVELMAQEYWESSEGDRESGEFVEGFWWMHHWDRIDIIDPFASEAIWGPPLPPSGGHPFTGDAQTEFLYEKNSRIRTKTERIDADFFGVKYWRLHRFVSPRLKKAIEDEGLRVSFRAIPLWRQNVNSAWLKQAKWFGVYG